MFERYTERARRVIFFARYEASRFGSTTIETEHLLLGLIREDIDLFRRASASDIRRHIEERVTIREKVSTSIDLPLSPECKRVLAYAAEEAERLKHGSIETGYLLLGMLREEKSVAAEFLHAHGFRLDAMREEMARAPIPPDPASARAAVAYDFRSVFPFTQNPALPEAGIVPDADTATRIAEAIWRPLYGAEAVKSQKPPLHVELQHGVVWIVTGSPSTEGTEVLSAFILKADGRILAVGRETVKG